MVVIYYSGFLVIFLLAGKVVTKPLNKLHPRQDTRASYVRITLDHGDITGSSQAGIDSFTGIPYADPPLGELRLNNPRPYSRFYNNFDATRASPACPQQKRLAGSSIPRVFTTIVAAGGRLLPGEVEGQEDCLTLNIHRPSSSNASDLPVLLYIYGGAFVFGATSHDKGVNMVTKSVMVGAPIIFVSINYRLGAFGFLGGKQVAEAGTGNLGLKDQRLAMEWVQKNIARFGGDPKKVTLAGHSAGAISVSHHMYAFGGDNKGLFRAAICLSGTALATGKLSEGAGQERFDTIVKLTGCQNDPNVLNCLRKIDYKTLLDAQNSVPGVLSENFYPLGFVPFIDGGIVPDTLSNALSQQKVAQIPLITGTVDDEGTILSLGQLTVSSEVELQSYLKRVFPKLTDAQVSTLLTIYSSDPSKGSPYGRTFSIPPTPVYRQFASLLGDYAFQARRRMISRARQATAPTWGYNDLAKKDTLVIGAYHGSERSAIFEDPSKGTARGDDYQRRWIAFINNMNPNVPGLQTWDTYGPGTGKILKIDQKGSNGMIDDDYRADAMNFLLQTEPSMMF